MVYTQTQIDAMLSHARGEGVAEGYRRCKEREGPIQRTPDGPMCCGICGQALDYEKREYKRGQRDAFKKAVKIVAEVWRECGEVVGNIEYRQAVDRAVEAAAKEVEDGKCRT